ncbi:hypothetical protein [Fumia xinanensis]|uniref:Uncharacterized protein n=1 Tax=Fumia xinanensis TaxID=2763659 RepID=A0A926E146_9FIRM|nr:hypothetical protein [Fumia xinanensis]MBC8559684.1 hypothetical protein [Fumia xinanensis]
MKASPPTVLGDVSWICGRAMPAPTVFRGGLRVKAGVFWDSSRYDDEKTAFTKGGVGGKGYEGQ